jgi:hypothetical protein
MRRERDDSILMSAIAAAWCWTALYFHLGRPVFEAARPGMALGLTAIGVVFSVFLCVNVGRWLYRRYRRGKQ